MRNWWVNQNQTFRHEIAGGYLWSPKRNSNGARNHFYETMREVAPGDVVFSFSGTRIAAIGVAVSNCWESPKPIEFGKVGENWENVGWKVNVKFSELTIRIRPADHLPVLRTLLPVKYSPLRHDGVGNQVYLAEISPELAEVLAGLIGPEAQQIAAGVTLTDAAAPPKGDDLDYWEHKLELSVAADPSIL
jgi:hypothetical protein